MVNYGAGRCIDSAVAEDGAKDAVARHGVLWAHRSIMEKDKQSKYLRTTAVKKAERVKRSRFKRQTGR